jgi:hypothetical protein
MISVNYTKCFGDKRLDARGEALHKALFRNGTRSIKGVSRDWAEQKGNYRFLHSEKTTEDKLKQEIIKRCSEVVKGKVVLAIQDTTEADLSAHSRRLKLDNSEQDSGLGKIDNDLGGIGFKIHPSLVVDARTCMPLGYSDIRIWHRPMDQGNRHERKYKQLPIEEKESYKWLETSMNTRRNLSEAEAVIIVQDREGDIFEQFFQIPDNKTFLLVRSFINRTTIEQEKLWNVLSLSPLLGQYQIEVSADSHSKEPARLANIEVRVVSVDIKPPVHDRKKKGQTVSVYAVEAREINSTSKEPILWRLVTTWPVNSYEDALMVIEWYSWRWFIEELFRILKKGGFDIERSELESGWAVRKLTIMLLDVIIKLMQLHIAYNELEEANVPEASLVFNEQEQQCLQLLNSRVEGKTAALKNPYPSAKLNNAAWTVARLGGWKGYKSQRPPGMNTMFNGLKKFYDIFDGWSLQKDVGTR